jgi:predicted dehydrogenase
MKINVIGAGSHFKRLKKILETETNTVIDWKIYRDVDWKTKEIIECDAIFITSPNDTHFYYLELLSKTEFPGYIFCEKPPITKIEELGRLKDFKPIKNSKVFFNFNYRFSLFEEILKNKLYISQFDIGRLLNSQLTISYGIAFKEFYKDNWRSSKIKNSLGVTENLLIHMIDLFIHIFGKPTKQYNLSNSFSVLGDSFDNSSVLMSFENGLTSFFYGSYTAPFIFNLKLIYENAIIEITESLMTVKYPRDTFDNNGLFKHPEIVFSKDLNFNEIYHNSLKKSLSCFVDIVKNKKLTDSYETQTTINTMSSLFKSIEVKDV